MLLVMIQSAKQISKVYPQNFCTITWRSRYTLNHALLRNSKKKSNESMHGLLSWHRYFFAFIFHYPSFPNALIFHTGKGLNLHNISIHSCHEALGCCRANALFGFHTFTGCQQTEHFMGKWTFYGKMQNILVEKLYECRWQYTEGSRRSR